MDTGASASLVGKHLAYTLEILKGVRKVKVQVEDESILRANFVPNASFKVMHSASVVNKFDMNVELLEIGKRYVLGAIQYMAEICRNIGLYHGSGLTGCTHGCEK